MQVFGQNSVGEAPDIRIQSAEPSDAAFYDQRFRDGYMSDYWPAWKLERVAGLITKAGLPATGRALDFGCGAGVFSTVIAEALPGWSVVGTDVSREALSLARQRSSAAALSKVAFRSLAEVQGEKFQFILSHHVLEHVPDLEAAWRIITNLQAKNGVMLHILPCGNSKSFEHSVCVRTRSGIDPETGRFFFEEETHLRRLTSVQMESLATSAGNTVEWFRYSNQWYGGMNWITDMRPDWILEFCDPARATSWLAWWWLRCYRRRLLALAGFKAAQRLGKPLSRAACRRLGRFNRSLSQEWEARALSPNGSEMYALMRRCAGRDGGRLEGT